MNKLERNLLKRNKFIRRIKLLKDKFYYNSINGLRNLKEQTEFENWTSLMHNSDFNCYRTTSTPCTDQLFKIRYSKKDRNTWKNHFDSELLNV